MLVHALASGAPPPGMQFAPLCGKASKEDFLTRNVSQVTCQDCAKILSSR